MEAIEKKIIELRKEKEKFINLENFAHYTDDDRYYSYLYNYVLSNTKNDGEIFDHIESRKFYGNKKNLTGIVKTSEGIKCLVPERETLYDEMVCIEEITRLISTLNNQRNDKTIYREVIPYFNVYEFLKQIHPFYAETFLEDKRNDSIKVSKIITDKNKNACLSYILAYYVLKKREDSYNIESLNKINANSKNIEKSLKLKGYTI